MELPPTLVITRALTTTVIKPHFSPSSSMDSLPSFISSFTIARYLGLLSLLQVALVYYKTEQPLPLSLVVSGNEDFL